MLLSLAFMERDPDAFLSSISHELYEEWQALFYLHPQGWNALNMVATRLSYMIAQKGVENPMNESDFVIRVAIPKADMPKTTAAREEAMRIRGEILSRLPNG